MHPAAGERGRSTLGGSGDQAPGTLLTTSSDQPRCATSSGACGASATSPHARRRCVGRCSTHGSASCASRARAWRVAGQWWVTPPTFPHPFSADLAPASDLTPTPEAVAWVEAFVNDHDEWYARIRPALAAEFAHWVGGSPPADWHAAVRLDSVERPGDVEEDPALWTVTYWCEGAQHWFVVDLRDRDVIDVSVEG